MSNIAVHRLATRESRLAAFCADGVLMVLVLAFPTWLVWLAAAEHRYAFLADHRIVSGLLAPLLGFGAFLLLNGRLLKSHGQTIGKRMAGICIVDQQGAIPPFWKLVGLRFLPPFLVGGFVVLDALFIFRQDRRCIHDLIAGTSVVDVSASSGLQESPADPLDMNPTPASASHASSSADPLRFLRLATDLAILAVPLTHLHLMALHFGGWQVQLQDIFSESPWYLLAIGLLILVLAMPFVGLWVVRLVAKSAVSCTLLLLTAVGLLIWDVAAFAHASGDGAGLLLMVFNPVVIFPAVAGVAALIALAFKGTGRR